MVTRPKSELKLISSRIPLPLRRIAEKLLVPSATPNAVVDDSSSGNQRLTEISEACRKRQREDSFVSSHLAGEQSEYGLRG